jgi:hypothetical protein
METTQVKIAAWEQPAASRRVVPLHDVAPTDVPAMLRRLASDVQEGKYGDVPRATIVLEANSGIEVFGVGQGCDERTMTYLMTAGAMAVVRNRVEN